MLAAVEAQVDDVETASAGPDESIKADEEAEAKAETEEAPAERTPEQMEMERALEGVDEQAAKDYGFMNDARQSADTSSVEKTQNLPDLASILEADQQKVEEAGEADTAAFYQECLDLIKEASDDLKDGGDEHWFFQTNNFSAALARYIRGYSFNTGDYDVDVSTSLGLQNLTIQTMDSLKRLSNYLLNMDGHGLDESTVKDDIGGARYSLNKSFEEQIEELQNGTFPRNDHLYVMETPQALIEAGLDQLPILMTQKHANSVMQSSGTDNVNYHGLGKDGIAAGYCGLRTCHPCAGI